MENAWDFRGRYWVDVTENLRTDNGVAERDKKEEDNTPTLMTVYVEEINALIATHNRLKQNKKENH